MISIIMTTVYVISAFGVWLVLRRDYKTGIENPDIQDILMVLMPFLNTFFLILALTYLSKDAKVTKKFFLLK